ncbi:MAG: epoxyqueuosine reductase QueH [Atopobiaceae bacterium]|nr:epoxyqueuosine reductase QueH [Atopobiaceae bacterium]
MPLLLHGCCGPCSLEPVRLLREQGYEPTILWSNPNIQPAAEHDRRLVTLLGWAYDAGLEVVQWTDDRERWECEVAPHGTNRADRCRSCYALRLEAACDAARELGFHHVSTTLAVSPHQLWDICTEELVRAAHERGLEPVVQDWRDRYACAQARARDCGMYCQNYCGCRFSAMEAQIERQLRRDARKRAKKLKNQESETRQPETIQLETRQPGVNQPETRQPETRQPGVNQPETRQPETRQTGVNQPETRQPVSAQALSAQEVLS